MTLRRQAHIQHTTLTPERRTRPDFSKGVIDRRKSVTGGSALPVSGKIRFSDSRRNWQEAAKKSARKGCHGCSRIGGCAFSFRKWHAGVESSSHCYTYTAKAGFRILLAGIRNRPPCAESSKNLCELDRETGPRPARPEKYPNTGAGERVF
jgi:hypothetical protein